MVQGIHFATASHAPNKATCMLTARKRLGFISFLSSSYTPCKTTHSLPCLSACMYSCAQSWTYLCFKPLGNSEARESIPRMTNTGCATGYM